MPDRADRVSQEAAEAVVKAQADVACDCLSAKDLLVVASPIIRAEVLAEMQERLTSDEMVGVAEEAFDTVYERAGGVGADTEELWRAAVRAVLHSTTKNPEEDGGPKRKVQAAYDAIAAIQSDPTTLDLFTRSAQGELNRVAHRCEGVRQSIERDKEGERDGE